MKFKFNYKKGELLIVYEGDEWDQFVKYFKAMGLKESETNEGFGAAQRVKYYRYESQPQLPPSKGVRINGENYTLIFDDNINNPIVKVDYDRIIFNLGIFRVIPNDSVSVVKFFRLPIPRMYLTEVLKEAVKEMYKRILTTNFEVEVMFSVNIKPLP